jgi:hypothetical protein
LRLEVLFVYREVAFALAAKAMKASKRDLKSIAKKTLCGAVVHSFVEPAFIPELVKL